MNASELGDTGARRAIELPADAPLLAITGPAASGKTETLARRYAALLARDPALAVAATIVTAPLAASARALVARIANVLPLERRDEFARDGMFAGVTLDVPAFAILRAYPFESRLALDLCAIDDAAAEAVFERAAEPLFSADWEDFLGSKIDPEIPGLRAPARFAHAALRLIRKLREAHIGPEAFLAAARRGATAFYANPPNLAAPALLFATKDEHRSSLAVDADERERQRLRELDLAKIIAKLYEAYVAQLVARGVLTPGDAIAEATRLLTEHPAIAAAERRRFRLAIVDDVHDLRAGDLRFLQALFGDALPGLTVAGNPDAATATFAGARPERIFGAARTTETLGERGTVPAQIAAVVRAVLAPDAAPPIPPGEAVRLHHAATRAAEVAFVADSVAHLIAEGTAAADIAVLHRNARTLGDIDDALVDRGIPVSLHGDVALFARHDTLDALALLWAAIDPFRHDRLLRALQLPIVGLNDATLSLLCGEPADAQALLFDLPEGDDSEGRRWDRRRDLRLGTNVVRGDRDRELEPLARERLVRFRERRARWQTLAQTFSPPVAARAILTDGGYAHARTAETAARALRRAALGEALLAQIATLAARDPGADLGVALGLIDRMATHESGPLLEAVGEGVVIAAIDCVKFRRFAHVFIPDVRAGSFPPYYVPDAFLFSPTYGMIPKDNVGEATTSRTAKFTWYQHQAKLRESYAREDRRALAVALARADRTVTVSMAGKATRGIAAPEFFTELERLPLVRVAAPHVVAYPDDAPPVVRLRQIDAPLAEQAVPLEWVAALATCVRCAPRRALVALSAITAPIGHERESEHMQVVAFAFGTRIIHGRIAAIERDGSLHAVVRGPSAGATAAIALQALGTRLAPTYFIRGDDGALDGPHPADPALAGRALAVLDGELSPICHLCAE